MADIKVVNVHELDPQRASLPKTSTYLDEEQARQAEINRARVENRKPNLDNPPAAAGTPLVKVGQVFNHPRNSRDKSLVKPSTIKVKAITKPKSDDKSE